MSMLKYLHLLLLVAISACAADIAASTDMPVSTTEPDASPGCKAPDIRFTVVRPETTTEHPYAKFETTQIYFPEDLTTADVELVGKHGVDMSAVRGERFSSGIVNPYQVDMNDDHHLTGLHADAAAVDSEETDDENLDAETRRLNQERRLNKKRRSGSGRRRRVENENGESRGRGGRYKRQIIHHDPDASPDTDKWSGGKLAAEGEVYYVHIEDILKSRSPNPELRAKLHKLKTKKNKCVNGAAKEKCKKVQNKKKEREVELSNSVTKTSVSEISRKYNIKNKKTHRRRRDESNHADANNFDLPNKKDFKIMRWSRDASESQEEPTVMMRRRRDLSRAIAEDMKRSPGEYQSVMTKALTSTASEPQNRGDYNSSLQENLQRVKRKSGKTTGALSRPKSGGDSSSKSSTSRKDKGVYEEEGGYSPVNPEETDDEEEEEEIEEEVDIEQQFTEVSEIRFPGEIGPLGDRRLCKIRCVKGKWVGPLCATNEEDDNGNVKFQPLYKSCHVKRIPSHLLLSYRNISVNVGWDLPHGHSLQARCKDLGLYKLLGESRVLCSNGLWAPRMPSCVPTTLLTNFSDDSAPSIRIKVLNGSGAFEPSGVLAILPGSTILLDCIYPRARGIPEWTWTSWHMQYPTGWPNGHEERNLRYRLTIKNIQPTDSGSFTCTLPRGLTNNIPIVVTTSTCPQLSDPVPPLTLRVEGNKLGHRAMYRCPSGYHTEGFVNATCLASGNWSSPAPTCHAIQCPQLTLEDPHLSLIELNTSAWGRAVFRCQWGFKLTGPPGLDCEPTGMWSGPVPNCRAIQCTMPVPPLNGRIGGSNLHQRRLTVGALVTFSCNEGHTLVGDASIICTESGFWSHSPPFCKSQCPYPGDPLNGLIAPLKFNYDAGDYLTVQCRPGFVQYSEHGPPERPKCQPDGNWSGPVPKCRSYEEV